MKRIFIAFSIIACSFTVKAQVPKPLHDSALKYFVAALKDITNEQLSSDSAMATIDRYNWYREQCLSHLKTEKQKNKFIDHLVMEAHKQVKFSLEPIKD